jgi:4-amino-4-deoxy-L-arabinose transferase-like glycosyltransferase
MQKQQPPTRSSLPSLAPVLPSFVLKPHAAWILAGAVGLVLLTVNLHFHTIGDYLVETDFYWSYAPEAQKILAGELPIEDFRGPGYPIALAAFGLATSDLFRAGVVIATLSAAIVIFFVFSLMQRLFRPDVAFVVVLFVALNTTFVQYSYTVGTDMMFCALVSASVFFLLNDTERRWRSVLLSALFSGLAYLTRYNGIYVVGAVPVVLLLVNPFQLSWGERLKTCALYLTVFFLVITPWGLYCVQERGSFFYNKNYLNIAYEMFGKDRIGWEQFWSVESQRYTSLTQVVFTDLNLFLKTILMNIVTHAGGDLLKLVGPYTGLFSVIGVVALLKRRTDKRVVSYFVLAGGFFVVLLFVFYGERFSLFLLPAYITLALIGLGEQRIASLNLFGRVRLVKVVVTALLVWTATDSLAFNRKNIDSGPKEVLSIAEAFQKSGEQPPPGAVIVTRKPHIAYYLKMRMELFPLVSSFDELKYEVRRVNGSYLYFSYVEALLRPQFQALLDQRNSFAWLKPVAYTNYPPAVLFRVDLQND